METRKVSNRSALANAFLVHTDTQISPLAKIASIGDLWQAKLLWKQPDGKGLSRNADASFLAEGRKYQLIRHV